MTLAIRPMTADRIAACLADLCPADAREIAAAGFADPHQMLADTLPICSSCEELHDGDVCLAVFGVVPWPGQRGTGVPWMLTTNAMERAGRHEVAHLAREVFGRIRRDFDTLTNWAHRENRRALRFIRWLGFRIDATPTGPGGEFLTFHWSK